MFLLNETHINNCKLYSKDINYAINKLNIGIGFDLVHSQHLKNVNNTYKEFIARLFSAFISHNYLPEKMLYGEIRPLIKNKLSNKCESNNFRPIREHNTSGIKMNQTIATDSLIKLILTEDFVFKSKSETTFKVHLFCTNTGV